MADENPSAAPPETTPPVNSGSSTERKYSPVTRGKCRRNVLILLGTVVVIVAGLILWRYLSSYESTDDAQADVHLYSVSSREGITSTEERLSAFVPGWSGHREGHHSPCSSGQLR